jgi:hypothetical protein
MRTTEEIVESIDNRLRELNNEIKALDAARVALDARKNPPSGRPTAEVTRRRRPRSGASSGTKRSVPARREPSAETSVESARQSRQGARTTSRARRSRGSKGVPADRLESLLSENGALTTSALAEQTDGTRDHVLTLLRELERAGRVRRTGQRRGTRWHAITDEDRIRERVAELEALQKRTE